MQRWWILAGLLALLLAACGSSETPIAVTIEAGKPSFLLFYADN